MGSNYKIHVGVELGEGSLVEEYCILGVPPRGKEPGELKTVIGSNALIRSHTVIYAGNVIEANFQTGHGAMVRECNRIGRDVSIGSHSIVEHDVIIGNGVRIHSNVFIPEFSVLDDGAWVGPNVVFTNAKYPRSPGIKMELKGPHLFLNVIIGANSTILPGVSIGAGAIVGAGSVVVEDVPEGKVVVGNPARIIKNVVDLRVYGIASEN